MIESDFLPKDYSDLPSNGNVTWESPSNIALIKYWGKYGEQLPANSSLSFTLSNCKTKTALKYQLKSVGERVVGVTGHSISGPFARYKEILQYVDENKVKEWRALDDAQMEFPNSETRLISCETDKGLGNSQIVLLKKWLAGSRKPHDITR